MTAGLRSGRKTQKTPLRQDRYRGKFNYSVQDWVRKDKSGYQGVLKNIRIANNQWKLRSAFELVI